MGVGESSWVAQSAAAPGPEQTITPDVQGGEGGDFCNPAYGEV